MINRVNFLGRLYRSCQRRLKEARFGEPLP
jgi:hypothetical protein